MAKMAEDLKDLLSSPNEDHFQKILNSTEALVLATEKAYVPPDHVRRSAHNKTKISRFQKVERQRRGFNASVANVLNFTRWVAITLAADSNLFDIDLHRYRSHYVRHKADLSKESIPYEQRSNWHKANLNKSSDYHKRMNPSQLHTANSTHLKSKVFLKAAERRAWALGE